MTPAFDRIEVRRPRLASACLDLIQAQPGRPLAMFAPRRVGKTHFLDHDLAPAARKANWLPVYADLWLQKDAPLEAINHALEEALDDVQVPARALARLGKTPVKKVSVLGASLDLGEPPARRALPAAPGLRLDALVVRLSQASAKAVLLMLDEVQTLADASGGESAVAALRAVLHKRRQRVAAVFTGSSQEGMVRMLSSAGSPMYQFAQLMSFPVLGDEYLQALASHFATVHEGKRLDLDAMRELFERLGYKPGLLRDVVKSMSAEGLTDPVEGLRRFVNDERQRAGWRALLDVLEPIDRLVLQAVARERAPMSGQVLDELAQGLGARPTIAKVRACLERLRRKGLLRREPTGPTRVEDPLLAEYLLGAVPMVEAAVKGSAAASTRRAPG